MSDVCAQTQFLSCDQEPTQQQPTDVLTLRVNVQSKTIDALNRRITSLARRCARLEDLLADVLTRLDERAPHP